MFLQGGLFVLSLAAIAQGAPRIIGGHDAPNHKYPYQISMRSTENGLHWCSGSILNERWILTASHCVAADVFDFVVVVGTNYLNETGTVYMPDLIINHEEYINFWNYDIALVRVSKDIVFTDFVKPIKLPTEDLKDYSGPANFSGWGDFTMESERPNALQEIASNVMTFKACKEIRDAISERHTCTSHDAGRGICSGDSGGPLAVDGVQLGIASYVTAPCATTYPDVFTRVFSYRDWILEKIELNSV